MSAESEPLFTGDRLADYPLYMCFNCTQATSQARCNNYRPNYSLSTKEEKTGDRRKGEREGGGVTVSATLQRGVGERGPGLTSVSPGGALGLGFQRTVTSSVLGPPS